MLDSSEPQTENKSQKPNDIFIEEQLAKTGARNATNLTGETNEESQLKTKILLMNARAFRASLTINDALRSKMQDWRLDTHSQIDDKTGKLQIKGDDGTYKEASFAEKVILEDNTHACTIGITEDEIQMQQYLNGEIDHPPAGFKELAQNWAKENGNLTPDTMTRNDYNTMLTQEFPHHAARMQYGDVNVTMGYGDSANDLLNLISKDSSVDWANAKPDNTSINPTNRLSTHHASTGTGIASKFTNFASPAGVLKPTETNVTFGFNGPDAPTPQ